MVMTNGGLNQVRDDFKDAGSFGYVALGTSTTTPTVSDSSLGAEVSGTRKAAAKTAPQDKVASLSSTLSTAEGNGYAMAEVGTFTASSGGTMGMRQTFTPQTKSSTQTWYIEVAHYFTGG